MINLNLFKKIIFSVCMGCVLLSCQNEKSIPTTIVKMHRQPGLLKMELFIAIQTTKARNMI